MHKMAAAWRSRYFCCFCHELSAIDIAFSAEILGRRWFGDSGTAMPLAVLPLFSAVLVIQMQKFQSGRHCRIQPRRDLDENWTIP